MVATVKLKACTTQNARKRHLSANLTPQFPHSMGSRLLRGATLCGQWGYRRRNELALLGGLPECLSCAKSAARIAREAK